VEKALNPNGVVAQIVHSLTVFWPAHLKAFVFENGSADFLKPLGKFSLMPGVINKSAAFITTPERTKERKNETANSE
jgi:hypothetical protein